MLCNVCKITLLRFGKNVTVQKFWKFVFEKKKTKIELMKCILLNIYGVGIDINASALRKIYWFDWYVNSFHNLYQILQAIFEGVNSFKWNVDKNSKDRSPPIKLPKTSGDYKENSTDYHDTTKAYYPYQGLLRSTSENARDY